MTTEQIEALETELDAIDYSSEVWTQEALDRRTQIVAALAAAGAL